MRISDWSSDVCSSDLAGFYGVPKAQRRTMELLRAVHLEDKANAYARTLSGGMKRRLLVAKAMVHSPPILVLDEPTEGVDLELRQQQIGRAHVCTPVTNAHTACRLLLEKKTHRQTRQ